LPESLRGRRSGSGVAADERRRGTGGERVDSARPGVRAGQPGRGDVASPRTGQDRRGGPPQDPRARIRADAPIDGSDRSRTPTARRSDSPRRAVPGDVRRSTPPGAERQVPSGERRVFRPEGQPPATLRRSPQEGIRRQGDGRPSISPGRPVEQGRDIRSIPGAGRPEFQAPSRRDFQPRIQGPMPGRGPVPSDLRQGPPQARPAVPLDRGGRPPVQMDRSPRSRTTSPRAIIRPDAGSMRQGGGADVRARVAPDSFRRSSSPSPSRSIRSAPQRGGRSSFSSQGGNRGRSSAQGSRGGGDRGGNRGRGGR
jgi:hypothetical protein